MPLRLTWRMKDFGVKARLGRIADRLQDPRPALKECGLVLLRSVARNFKEGGRPVRWKASKRALREGGKTLIDTARLKNSIHMKVWGKILLRVGTNVEYAAIQHLGGRIEQNVTVKQHYRIMRTAFGNSIPARRVLVRAHPRKAKIKLPARPFLMAQGSDIRIFRRIFADYIKK